MASISANGSNGHHKFTLNIVENSTSVANNTSSVSFSFVLSPIQNSWNWDWSGTPNKLSYNVTINGTSYTGTIPTYDGYATVTLKSGTLNIGHNTDGTKSISFSFSVTDTTGQTYTCGNASGSGSMNLTTIARYLSINSIEFANKTETSVVVKWSVSDPRSSTYYSFDNGATWIGSATYGETLANDNKSGSFNIPNLIANTTYNLKVKFRRADNDLWTESGNHSFTTYDYPHVTDTPDFVIGNEMYMTLYNPLGRTVTATMYGDDGSLIWTGTGWTGTRIGSNNAPTDIENLYKSIPNKRSGIYKIRIQYDTYSDRSISGGTYSIVGNEIPTINDFSYFDDNNDVVAITQNNQHIVQNKSILKAQFTAATPNYGASRIVKYSIYCNGIISTYNEAGEYSLGNVDSAKDFYLTLFVEDSRGLTAAKHINVTMKPHSDPTAIVTLKRKNNYEDETYLTVDGSISPVDGKNGIKSIQYRHKVSGGGYGGFENIGDGERKTLYFDKNNVYIFNIVVTDSFGSKYDKEYTLGKGIFPFFIDTEKNSVGVNCFPNNKSSIEVNGLGSFGSIKCKNLLYTPYTENNKLTIAATIDDNAVEVWYYCYLEEGKTYTFSCETDGDWGFEYGTDTVEVFLLKDNAYTTIVSINSNPKTFTVPITGSYFLRCDVNKSGATYSFWNFQIEEGTSATEYVEAKQFEYPDQYFLGEHQIGYWFDGKPLYRTVISLNGNQLGTVESATGVDVNIPHNISNIQEIVKMEDVWRFGDQYRNFPTNFYGTGGWDGQYFCTKTHICFELNANVYNSVIFGTKFLYIMIYYTKTTD